MPGEKRVATEYVKITKIVSEIDILRLTLIYSEFTVTIVLLSFLIILRLFSILSLTVLFIKLDLLIAIEMQRR